MPFFWRVYLIILGYLISYGLTQEFTSNNVSSREISALYDLYTATRGYNWTWRSTSYGQIWNFSTNPVDPCNWQGISCNTSSNINYNNTFIYSLELVNYNLRGSIPASISNLTYLNVIYLNENYLTGKIPNTTCDMIYLYDFEISENQVTGHIPSCIFQQLIRLEYFSILGNFISGPLPEFDIMPALNYLILMENQLIGTIPKSISNLIALKRLYLGTNLLSGNIENIIPLTKLTRLGVNDNGFTSTIPSSIGNLSKLEYIYLHESEFDGSFPSSMSSMTRLFYLTSYENHMTGVLPASFAAFVRMETFIINSNYYTGILPNIFDKWPVCFQLSLYSNYFSGNIPSTFSTMKYLQLLLLQANLFSGSPTIGFNRSIQLNLETLDISSNDFTGLIPSEIFGKSLRSFTAFLTCFAGSLPDSICDSKALEIVDFDGMTSFCEEKIWPGINGSPYVARRVPGGIPECIWKLANITDIHMSGNGFTGTIPDLPSYGNLTVLDLSFNSMHGRIPNSLQSWHKLNYLNLQNNRFTGPITDMQFLNFAYDENDHSGVTLYLSKNRLSGIIPLAMFHAQSIDIVEGNLFTCSARHDPPIHDPNSANYVCASNLLDISLWAFIPCGAIAFTFVMILLGIACRSVDSWPVVSFTRLSDSEGFFSICY